MTTGWNKIINEKQTGEEARQRVLCEMVKNYKIKTRHCIHEHHQSDCTRQPKQAYEFLALDSKIKFEVPSLVWYQNLENMTIVKKESHPNQKTACIMYTLLQQ